VDRKKRYWAIAAVAAASFAGASYYSTRTEEAPKAKAQEKTLEEQRIEELVNLMSAGSGGGGETGQAPPAIDLPSPAAPVPMPEGEAFDMDAAARSYRRSAENADAADYYNCDGDCSGLGAGMTMDGSEAPTMGEGFGRAAPLPEARPLPEPGPLDQGPE
jgi:hypothetical protein